MHRAGGDPATQQYIMGHADYETTANSYTHIDSADIEEARRKMTGLLPRLLPVPEDSGK
jgi:integrase